MSRIWLSATPTTRWRAPQNLGRSSVLQTSSNVSPFWRRTAAVTVKPRASSVRPDAIRQRTGAVRFKVWDAGYEALGGRATKCYGQQ